MWEVCCRHLERPCTALNHLIIISYDLKMLNAWMLKIHSFATITIETISIPLARLKDHKTQKTCIIRASWEPFNIGEGNRMLKIQQSYGGRRAGGWMSPGHNARLARVAVSCVASPAPAASPTPRPPTHDIAFSFYNSFTINAAKA